MTGRILLGLAGLVGSKRSNVAEAIFGVRPAASGEILIDGKPVQITSPKVAMDHGLAFLTEDRKETGCFLILDCLENIQSALITRDHVKAGFIDQKTVTALAEDAFCHHHLSASFDALPSGEKQALFDRNKALYEDRWGAWVPHRYREGRPASTLDRG